MSFKICIIVVWKNNPPTCGPVFQLVNISWRKLIESHPKAIPAKFHLNSSCLFVCLFDSFGLNVAFNNLSVISRRCLDVAGSSILSFRMLPHWNITLQTLWHDIPPSHIILTLRWPVLALLTALVPWPQLLLNAERQTKEQLVPF